jgi:hypothetical protein
MAEFRIAPFSLYSSSVETGYMSEISESFLPHIDITNLHEDRYGNFTDAPMQGPFTYKYVGGSQQRHVPLNKGDDTSLTRPELFDITMSSGLLTVRGPDTVDIDRPRAPYYRGLMAKRPLNIENIQMRTGSTIIGNYSNDYELIQTVGRTSNNRAFVEAEGVGFIGDPSLPFSGSLVTQFVSGARDFTTGTALPVYDLSGTNKSVFVNRFNAPGGTDVSSRGVLDTYAEEYAPNNAMPWRNDSVRSVLRSDLTRHTPKATDITCPVTPTLYHTDNRNTRYYKQTPPTASIQDLVTAADGIDTPFGIALDISAGKMYWTDFNSPTIKRANLGGADVEVLVLDTGGATDTPRKIALDVCAGKMYWTDSTEDKIQRANLEIPVGEDPSTRTDIETLVSSVEGLISPAGIALDVPAGKMYWTDFTTNKIQRADLDGDNIEDLVTSMVSQGCAVAASIGKIYWTEFVDDKIYRANLDGSNVEEIFEAVGTSTLGGIAIDTSLGKIYWTESSASKIQRANLDGSSVETLVTVDSAGDIAIDISAGKMYWPEFVLDKIQRANMPEKPVYDNGYITHAIPQSSLQYSWIKSSAITDRTQLLGYQNSGSY